MQRLKPFSVYTHHSGRRYFLIGIANKRSTNLEKFPPMAVYFNLDNYTFWVRKASEFADASKFKWTWRPDVSLALRYVGDWIRNTVREQR